MAICQEASLRYAVGQFLIYDIHGAKYVPKANDGDFEYRRTETQVSIQRLKYRTKK